jgi:hypothetical protein
MGAAWHGMVRAASPLEMEMTSSRERNGFAFCCDVCGDVIDPPTLGRGSAPRDFEESLTEAKAKGWRAVNIRGEWQHLCPDCAA